MDKTHTTETRFHHATIGTDPAEGQTVWVAEFDAMPDIEPPVTDVYRTRAQAVAAILEDIEVAQEVWADSGGSVLDEVHDYCDTCGSTPLSTWTLRIVAGGPIEGRWQLVSKTLR